MKNIEQGFIDILKKLVAEQGKEALLNPAKCRAFISDYAGSEYKKERRFIVQAAAAGVSKAIDGEGDLASCKKAQTRELVEEFGLGQEVAQDIVDALAQVLRGEEKPKDLCNKCGKEMDEEWKVCPFCGMQAAQNAGTDGDTAFMEGRDYLEECEYDKAEESFTRAIYLGCSDMYRAYVLRGDCAEVDQAICDYTTAIGLDPNNADAYIKRGDAYCKEGQNERAISDYTTAISLNQYSYTTANGLDPKNVQAYLGRGNVYQRLRQYDLAVIDLTTAILDLNFSVNLAFSSRGEAYFNKGQYDLAVSDFTTAIDLNQYNAAAYHWRGMAYYKKHQYDLAVSDFTTAIGFDPNNADAYHWRGAAYCTKGQYDQAVIDLSIVIGLNSNNADAYYWRGRAYFRKGMKYEAIRDAEKALSLNPDSQTYKDNLQEMQGG